MTLKLLFANKDDDRFKITLGTWVTQRVFMTRKLRPEDFEVIAVAQIAPNKQPLVIAGLLYHDYCALGNGGKIEISMASEDPRWAQKGIIRALLHYPFIQLRCHIVICTTNRTNKRTRKFLEGIGFSERGTVPNRPYADDTIIYAMRIETAIKRGWVSARQEEKAA